MSATVEKAALVLSVDLDADIPSATVVPRQRLDAVAGRLLEMFARHDVSATWAIANPAASGVIARIASCGVGHEIALLEDSSWAGPDVGRAAFDRQLERRIAAAAARGVSISTLVLGSDRLDERCAVAIQHGIRALRHAAPRATGRLRGRQRPGTLGFGVWSFPVHSRLPGNSRLLPGGGGGRAVCRVVDRAVADRGLITLAIGARDLAARGFAAWRVLDRVMAYARRRRRQGVLEIATLEAVAAGFTARYASVPSHSILRPAA